MLQSRWGGHHPVGLERPLPAFLAPLFWDVDLASIRPGHETFVIERVLNYGDIPAMAGCGITSRTT